MIGAYIVFVATYLYENFREFSLIIKIAAVSLTISIVLIMFCLCRMIYKSWVRRRWKRVMEHIEERYGDGVKYILSAEAKPNMSRNEVLDVLDISDQDLDKDKLLKNRKEKLQFCRMVYHARISKDAVLGRRRNLHILLNIFGVQEFLEEMIIKDSVRLKVEALQMLRAFKVPINQWVANQLMNSKRSRVRRLAMYASIMSSSNTDLEYFESEFFDTNCCAYDEIQLGYVLRRRQSSKRKIPNLAYWANMHKNEKTQCVFIRLMRQFNQREYCADLVDLFRNSNDREIIEEISRTWGYLGYEEGESLMSETLLAQPDDVKVAIMHALTRIGTGNSIDALVDGYKNSGDQRVRLEALRCLYNYGEKGRAKFDELELTAATAAATAVTAADKGLFTFFHNPIAIERMELSEDDIYRPLFGDNIYTVG